MNNILSTASTICELTGIQKPASMTRQLLTALIDKMKSAGIPHLDRCIVYAPDAIGSSLYTKYAELFKEMEKFCGHREKLLSVYPSKTPVCFASMFTGAMPEIHGIKKYERPVLKIETLFDAAIKGSLKPAIAAVKDSSIDLIFRERQMDYYTEADDHAVIERTIELMQRNFHEIIVAYNCEYDDNLHATTPFSDKCMQAVKDHNRAFIRLIEAADKYLSDYNRLIIYAPDHGAHYDELLKRGNHGEDIPEDMEVMHFYSFAKGTS
jgi:hypothetical protein